MVYFGEEISDFQLCCGCFTTMDWLICDWIQDLTVPMHLGHNWWSLCAPYRFMGALLLY